MIVSRGDHRTLKILQSSSCSYQKLLVSLICATRNEKSHVQSQWEVRCSFKLGLLFIFNIHWLKMGVAKSRICEFDSNSLFKLHHQYFFWVLASNPSGEQFFFFWLLHVEAEQSWLCNLELKVIMDYLCIFCNYHKGLRSICIKCICIYFKKEKKLSWYPENEI